MSKYWILLERGSYAKLHFISILHELFTKPKSQLNIITLGFLCITKTKSMSNHMDVMFTSSSPYRIVWEIALVSLISCSIWTFYFFHKKSNVPINVKTAVHIKKTWLITQILCLMMLWCLFNVDIKSFTLKIQSCLPSFKPRTL